MKKKKGKRIPSRFFFRTFPPRIQSDMHSSMFIYSKNVKLVKENY